MCQRSKHKTTIRLQQVFKIIFQLLQNRHICAYTQIKYRKRKGTANKLNPYELGILAINNP